MSGNPIAVNWNVQILSSPDGKEKYVCLQIAAGGLTMQIALVPGDADSLANTLKEAVKKAEANIITPPDMSKVVTLAN